MDLGPKSRRVFCALYVVVQLYLIGSAHVRPDRLFGFQMFNESSSLRFDLMRRVDATRRAERRRRSRGTPGLREVPVEAGAWQEQLPDGSSRNVQFGERVRYSSLNEPGRFRHATYGADAQIFRLQCALDDVLLHLPANSETRQLGARVEVIKNGRRQAPLELWSRQR